MTEAELIELVEKLMLQTAEMTLSIRSTIAVGVSPNKVLEVIRSDPRYEPLAVRNAEAIVKLVVEELKG